MIKRLLFLTLLLFSLGAPSVYAGQNEERDFTPGFFGPPKPEAPAGFSLMCYRCSKVTPVPNNQDVRCHGSDEGPCTDSACSAGQECEQYPEKSDKGEEYFCHNCNDKAKDACEGYGYTSDGNCNGTCEDGGECVPVDVDKTSGKIVPSHATREKGMPLITCFACRYTVEITYIIVIIEAPYERFVLDGGKSGPGFKFSSVMALAKVDKATGMIPNVEGKLKAAKDFLGAFNIGSGPMGLATTGSVSMEQLSGLLSSGLFSGGEYGSACFDNVLQKADAQAVEAKTPTSQDIAGAGAARKKDGKLANSEILTEDQIRKSEEAGAPAVSGPVIACGEENGSKVLKVYDSSGTLVGSITRSMLKADPKILTEKLGMAQQLTDRLKKQAASGFASYVEKFTGLPLKKIQAVVSEVGEVSSKAGKAARKNKDHKEDAPVIPNDPLYLSVEKHKSAGFSLGFLSAELPQDQSNKAQREGIKDQWGIRQVGYLPESDPNSAWNVVDATQKNIVVAVVDSGLDLAHPDGPQYVWTNPKEIPGNGIDDDHDGFIDDVHGWNFKDDNNDLTDYRGHGTFVAGIIAAKYNNGVGIAGIDPGAVIMPIKVTDDEGQTDNLAIYRGINYAVDHGARVINVSLGGKLVSRLEQQAIERANAMGALVVLASGNNNTDLMEFGPSSTRQALAVGMVDIGGARSLVSGHGANLGLLAPGEQIFSLCSKDAKKVLPSIRKYGYLKMDGTSFSAPMVTGTAALILAKDPLLTNHQAADRIMASATRMGNEDWSSQAGAGFLNAAAALRTDADDQLVLMITNFRVNRDVYGKVISVDVFGTVVGQVKEFNVELGRGRNAGSFVKVAGPFHDQARSQFLARINVREKMYATHEWTIRIKAIDARGKERSASAYFKLPDK